MTQNKYELRSNEVQEVMNNPPHSLITWGNTIILSSLIGGLYFLSLIQFPNKINVPFQLIISEKKVSLLINTELPKEIKVNQPISLSFESYPIENYGEIKSNIDSINKKKPQITIIVKNLKEATLTNNDKLITLYNNQLGTAKITIGQNNIFGMYKNKLNPFTN